MIPTLKQAQTLLEKYNKQPFHLKHAHTVSGVMRYFAKEYDPKKEDFWAVVGLLHDIDFEQFPDEHCVKGEEILRENNISEDIIHATMSHGYGLTGIKHKPEQFMEKILFATDELTGLIGAVALMRPSKSVQDLELKSVKKKFKDKKFAAGCSRDVIEKGADMLGWSLDELIEKTIRAMRTVTD
ncbi:HD domain-containing protein [Candidatus Saccharibacteria bacterium]|nr:HD domain-containing protein [Candidatus Saccharibacteria bacterium]